jgi:hypothetical protein
MSSTKHKVWYSTACTGTITINSSHNYSKPMTYEILEKFEDKLQLCERGGQELELIV